MTTNFQAEVEECPKCKKGYMPNHQSDKCPHKRLVDIEIPEWGITEDKYHSRFGGTMKANVGQHEKECQMADKEAVEKLNNDLMRIFTCQHIPYQYWDGDTIKARLSDIVDALSQLGYTKPDEKVREKIREEARQLYWWSRQHPKDGETVNLEQLTERFADQILSITGNIEGRQVSEAKGQASETKEALTDELPLLSDEEISTIDLPTEDEVIAFRDDGNNEFGDADLEYKTIASYAILFAKKAAQAQLDLIQKRDEKVSDNIC